MPVTRSQFDKIALSFPGAHEKSHYGNPSIFIEKKFFTRFRKDDSSIVMRVGSIEQRDMMLELDPGTYFITDHYKEWPGLLVRISKIPPKELQVMLERRWQEIAPKRLLNPAGRASVSAKPAKTPKPKSRAKPGARKNPVKKR